MSDATFKILGSVTGFSASGATCVAGELSFSWNAVTNATHYDIFRLNETTGEFESFAANLTGTTHTVGSLTPGTTMWFYIAAKNNISGAIGNRSNAISGVVSTGGGGLGAIGSINGQSIVCSATAAPYSIAAVSGATLYTWTAPPGATIASGQGTTNITINYTGASNGNVSVFASAGSCQTPTVTLGVTVGPASVASPASGGNQTVTACPPNPIPTLTATATVGAGHTVIWYNAATGGSVVASPTLSTVGTVTYYASSQHTASGCESPTRTPVVLTIDAAPPATISASGPISFCQGGSVMLTANSGSSYTWSNGATTQSITVTSSGTFTVVVTQTGGCTGTSSPTTVTVNPIPLQISQPVVRSVSVMVAMLYSPHPPEVHGYGVMVRRPNYHRWNNRIIYGNGYECKRLFCNFICNNYSS